MEMLGTLGKSSLDTDLRKDKSQGALEVIKLIDNLTRVTTDSAEDTKMKDTTDISDAALFDSMLRLGLPTDRDIDLRKRFMDDEPERTDCLEVDQCAKATQHLHSQTINCFVVCILTFTYPENNE